MLMKGFALVPLRSVFPEALLLPYIVGLALPYKLKINAFYHKNLYIFFISPVRDGISVPHPKGSIHYDKHTHSGKEELHR